MHNQSQTACILLSLSQEQQWSLNIAQLDTVVRALQQAADNGDVSAAEQLLPPGTNADDLSWTALHSAAAAAGIVLIEQLLGAGLDVNRTSDKSMTPLMCAAGCKCVSAAGLLPEKGTNVDAVDRSGWTALHTAANNDCTPMAEVLIAKGAVADAEIKNDMGNSVIPLHLADRYDHTAVAKLLLKQGAAVDSADCTDATPLHMAAAGWRPTTAELD